MSIGHLGLIELKNDDREDILTKKEDYESVEELFPRSPNSFENIL